jgi:hypothetical protein
LSWRRKPHNDREWALGDDIHFRYGRNASGMPFSGVIKQYIAANFGILSECDQAQTEQALSRDEDYYH